MGNGKPLDELSQCFKCNKIAFSPWIEYLRFPNYKALEPNSCINFTFPITILVGKNGVNKTSILHALYGAPGKQSIGKYWFSTEVDRIDDKDKLTQCMIYGYKHNTVDKIVEVLKTRINNEQNLDYWEPARPQKQYNMVDYNVKDFTKVGSTLKTRWETIEKEVVFCDNKEYVSAYDLLFYHSTYKGTTRIKSRQDFIRYRSKSLGGLLNNSTSELKYWGKNRLILDKHLDKSAINVISTIMGDNYENIRIIKHSLYTNLLVNDCMIRPAETIVIKKKGFQYSEAFAGSGESRLILLVDKILSVKNNSLLLIDEPEISLHPEAIHRFKEFLIKETLVKKLQVVVTTHSSHFIEGFPPEAIKVLTRINDRVLVSDNIDYRNAFYSIGASIDSRITILVEDRLVEELFKFTIGKTKNRHLIDNIDIKIYPGGAESIIKSIPSFAIMGESHKIIIVLDGDKYKNPQNSDFLKNIYMTDEHIRSIDIPSSLDDKLEDIFKEISGVTLKNIPIDGNHSSDNMENKSKIFRRIIDYWSEHVTFLGKGSTPEALLIKASQNDFTNDNSKVFFENEAKKQYGKEFVSSNEILEVQKGFFKLINTDSDLKIEIERIIKMIENSM